MTISLILAAAVVAICGWLLVAGGTRKKAPQPDFDRLLAPYSPKCNICGKPATRLAYDEAICARCDAMVTAVMRRRAG